MLQRGCWVKRQPPKIVLDEPEYLIRAETSYLDKQSENGLFESTFIFHVNLWKHNRSVLFALQNLCRTPDVLNIPIAAEIAFNYINSWPRGGEKDRIQDWLHSALQHVLDDILSKLTHYELKPQIMYRLAAITTAGNIDDNEDSE